MTSIGLIPQEWDIMPLGELCEFRNGYTPSKAVKGFWENGTIPWFRMEDIREHGRILSDAIQHVTKEAIKGDLFSPNSIIMSTTATIGEHALLIADSLANQRFTNLKIRKSLNDKVDVMWLYWYCYKIGEWCRENIHEGGLAAVNIVDLAKLEIPIPSLDEQKRIADALSAVDELIGALDEAVAKKRQIKEGLMQQLLTGKTRLPGFSGELKESTLGQLADICKGIQFDSDLLSDNGCYPMLNGGITPSGYSEFYNTEAETITISEGGNSCGYVNYMSKKFWCGGHCYSLKVKAIDKIYLYQLLKFNEKDIMALRVGSGLPNVQSKSLIDFRLYYPDNKQEQENISIILKKADDEIAGLESQRDKYALIKQGMMQELLTGHTRLK